ncbi:Bromodomain containing protein [Mycena indigotica]|uniref:Bromodomain containing protein n=1 Tax=Mycena indigotica TaxID=2126181 RepID=A0A8H6WAT2_9AGAR|nr:Bromodomain containing protein [Mycena indigotica]KAF7309481.1 Bromodomain containing protein [Mycena indigotica]
MARGGQVGEAAPPLLPTVSFQKIENDVSTQPSGVHDHQAKTFGYNDGSEFNRPDQYIRHIEPLEADLERQVEYDMDEQDQEWLDAVNAERKKEQIDKVSYEVFEVVMDRLDKEWFNLTKRVPKNDLALPSEDSTCAVCDDPEGENSNAIVFCDGCNLAVHQDCYGVPYIPEGQWLCRKCTVSPENPVSCILCPNEGGAFKQTTQGKWIHLLCAIWVPETRVSNDAFMEPIIGVNTIPKSRWKLRCSLCDSRHGACIQCARPQCFLAFHVSCARQDKLLLPMKSTQGSESATLSAYCEKHLPREQAQLREEALKEEEEQEAADYSNAKLAKSARAYAKTYKPGPPLVPASILERIQIYVNRVNIRKKPEFLAMMCRYWSLKREARRGAPLLKRLHLEPWTASTNTNMDGEEEKQMKLEQLQHLRTDLEALRNLTELTRRRETRKLKQAELINEVIAQALFPHMPRLRAAFTKIVALDRSEYFKMPVKQSEVPDYFDVITTPMSWSIIEEKLETFKYWDLQVFKDDVDLVLNNALQYNKPGTPYHKTALRIQAASVPILTELSNLCSSPNLRSPNEDNAETAAWVPTAIGDLEPPLEVLDLLLSSDAIQVETDLLLSADPITSLFNFELAQQKPNLEAIAEAERKEERKLQAKAKREQAKADKLAKQEAARERQLAREQEKEAAAAQIASALDPDESTHEAALALASLSAPVGIRVTRGALAQVTAQVDPEPPVPIPIPDSISAPPTTRRRRKASPQEHIPTDFDPDVMDSFVKFGWSPRRTRQSTQSIGPPPRKKARQDSGPSSLSPVRARDSVGQQTSAGDKPAPARRGGRKRSAVIPPPKVIRTDTGEVIIEELDTPEIRREKSARRKLEIQMKRDAEAVALAKAAEAEPPTTEQSGALHDAINGDDLTPDEDEEDADVAADVEDNKSSDLSDIETEAEPEPQQMAPPNQVNQPIPETEPDGTAEFAQGITLRIESEAVPMEEDDPISGELTPSPQEDVEMVDVEEPKAAPSQNKRKRGRQIGDETWPAQFKDLGRITLREGASVEPGTLVWVKIATYPWWPAVVFHDNDPMVPPKVLKEARRKRETSTRRGFLHVVRFWDKESNSNWQSASVDQMRMLCESKGYRRVALPFSSTADHQTELDEELCRPNSQLQKYKGRNRSDEIQAAYNLALGEMESGDEKSQFLTPI